MKQQSFTYKNIHVIISSEQGVFMGYCVHLPKIGYTEYYDVKTKKDAKDVINKYLAWEL